MIRVEELAGKEYVSVRLLGGDVDDPGWSRLYEAVKAVDVFDLLLSGIWLIWRIKVLCE